jgi:hypothetical protein
VSLSILTLQPDNELLWGISLGSLTQRREGFRKMSGSYRKAFLFRANREPMVSCSIDALNNLEKFPKPICPIPFWHYVSIREGLPITQLMIQTAGCHRTKQLLLAFAYAPERVCWKGISEPTRCLSKLSACTMLQRTQEISHFLHLDPLSWRLQWD